MLGAGVFAVFAPAAQASGGTYVYGRERLGPFWGYLAGWGFVVGKTASCAAIALTFAAYVAPSQQRVVAAAAVLALTALNYVGVQKSLVATRVLVAATLGTLAVVVVAGLTAGGHGIGTPTGPHGVVQAAGARFV